MCGQLDTAGGCATVGTGFSRGTRRELLGRMVHQVARAVRGRLLFRTWDEAWHLWNLLVTLVLAPTALVLMPDHLHLQHAHDVRKAVAQAARAHAKWLNKRRRTRARLWEPIPICEPLADRQKERRSERYVALNPCRKGLVRDPLEWAFSTHRDAVGLTPVAVRPKVARPHEYHHYVSADPTVDVQGTLLPTAPLSIPAGEAGLAAVFDATSALFRATADRLRTRGPARTALINAMLCLVPEVTRRDVADFVCVNRRTLQRADSSSNPTTRAIERVVLDPRFARLESDDLRKLPAFRFYRNRD